MLREDPARRKFFVKRGGKWEPVRVLVPLLASVFPTKFMKFLLVSMLSIGLTLPLSADESSWQSKLVTLTPEGALEYHTDAEGNRIPDFSHAGYRGGGVPLPNPPVRKTLSPEPGDNTKRIQKALDEIGTLPLDPATGLRGALLLEPGIYEVTDTIRISQSGVALLGSGQGENPEVDTIIRRTGSNRGAVILAGGAGRTQQFAAQVPNTRMPIVTPRVTVGSFSFDVADTGAFSEGETIVIEHPATKEWLKAIEGGGTDSAPAWDESISEITIRYLRRIRKIEGNTITIDAPVFNHLDSSLSPSFIYKHDMSPFLSEIGVGNLRIDIVTKNPGSEDHAWDGVVFRRAVDCWVRDVTVLHFVYSGVKFWEEFARGTAYNCQAIEPHGGTGGARRYNFVVHRGAQLVLFEKCHASYGRHAFVSNGGALDSGIVFLDCSNDRSYLPSEGHRRWPQALLFDGLTTTNPHEETAEAGIIGLYNRGSWGGGHGWGAVHSVAWRCDTGKGRIIIQKPPTAQNYAIGCSGRLEGKDFFSQPQGYIEGQDREGLIPPSLYRAQLAQRLKQRETKTPEGE